MVIILKYQKGIPFWNLGFEIFQFERRKKEEGGLYMWIDTPTQNGDPESGRGFKPPELIKIGWGNPTPTNIFVAFFFQINYLNDSITRIRIGYSSKYAFLCFI